MDSDTGTLGAACCQYVRGGRARPLGSVSIIATLYDVQLLVSSLKSTNRYLSYEQTY
ncbi:hypothetical protein J6590_044146 [Homalodisca vitripennis]|nr:hypothetical protein J6590_044146 [Homalodisca vitripennis]